MENRQRLWMSIFTYDLLTTLMTTKWWVIYASDSLIVLGAVSQSRKKEGTSKHVKNFNQLISNRINILQFKKASFFRTVSIRNQIWFLEGNTLLSKHPILKDPMHCRKVPTKFPKVFCYLPLLADDLWCCVPHILLIHYLLSFLSSW